MNPPLLTVNKNQKDEYKKWMLMLEARLEKDYYRLNRLPECLKRLQYWLWIWIYYVEICHVIGHIEIKKKNENALGIILKSP